MKLEDSIVGNRHTLAIKPVGIPGTGHLCPCWFKQAVYFTTRLSASQISQGCGNAKLGRATFPSQQTTEGFIWSGKLTKTNSFSLLRALAK